MPNLSFLKNFMVGQVEKTLKQFAVHGLTVSNDNEYY